MTRSVLVAGASGWLGQKITEALLRRGAELSLLLRGGKDHKKAHELDQFVQQGARIVSGDVLDKESLVSATQNVEVIVSALQGGPDLIIDGQFNLAEAGLAAGARRIFPSDFAVDFSNMPYEDHIFLGWRRHAHDAISRAGLAQTNMYNGAFAEMLDNDFFGLVDVDAWHVHFWVDPVQPYDFTKTDDVAEYLATAAMDETTPSGPFRVTGFTISPREISKIALELRGRELRMNSLRSLDELDLEIKNRQLQSPQDPSSWVGLQYHRAMASGTGKLNSLDNTRYPEITPKRSREIFEVLLS